MHYKIICFLLLSFFATFSKSFETALIVVFFNSTHSIILPSFQCINCLSSVKTTIIKDS